MSAPAVLLLAIVLLALNLRPVMAGLGPLLDLVEADLGLDSATAGLLTTLPVLIMGLGAYAAQGLHRAVGPGRGILAGILLIALGCGGRLICPGGAGMMASALTAGLGIALVQALLPGVIKQGFPAGGALGVGRVMGLYTTAIMSGAALAAATAATLAQALGWRAAMAVWAAPALLAALVWLGLGPSRSPADTGGAQGESPRIGPAAALWSQGRAWLLTAFFGISTSAYTLVLAWLPPYCMAQGLSREASGYLMAGLTAMEVTAGFTVSALIGRFPDRRGPLALTLALALLGLAGLAAAPGTLGMATLGLPCALVLGLGIGALFPLTLILTLDHADGAAKAGRLAAFVQGGGYVLASAMPFLAGAIRDRFADLSHAWALMAVGIAALLALVVRLGPGTYTRLR